MDPQFKKPTAITVLQWIHIGVFLLTVATVSLLHAYTQNFLDIFRLPTFLKDINPFLGYSYPASLHVYQFALVFYVFLNLIDGLGLFFYKNRIWRLISDITSFLGFLVIWPVGLFFLFTIASADNLGPESLQTALTYFAISFILFMLDLITCFVDEQSIIKLPSR